MNRGQGIILRCNEIKGQPTRFIADLSWFLPVSATETSLIENDTSPLTLLGNKITFTIPADGMAKEVTFPNKTVTWVKFQVSGGTGFYVGLSEIEVYVP